MFSVPGQIPSSFPVHESMTARDLLADRIRAHLEALEAAELERFEADAIALALAAAGDAIRIGVPLPPRLSRWIGGLSRQKIDAACGFVVQELDETLIPAGDDSMLEAAVESRDRAESARVGVLRTCVSQRWIPYEVEGYRRLHEACARFDAVFVQRASREAIALALGDRAWLDNDKSPAHA